MISIFTTKLTPRIIYTFELIFNHVLKVDFELISNAEHFLSLDNPKFSYGKQPLGDELFFFNNGFLLEKNIRPKKINVDEYKELIAFFFHESPKSVWPFDPFALSFYLASRYEEYLPSQKDQHGRFSAKESLAYKKGFLQLPLVNLWAKRLSELLQEKFPNFSPKTSNYQFTPSYDIDHAWAFKHKGFLRTTANILKDIGQLDFKRLRLRFAVLANKRKDPFFTFPYLDNCFGKFELKPLFFFLVGKYGVHDKNVSIEKSPFRDFIKKTAKQYAIGIHPSYGSNTSISILEKEISNLVKVTEKNVKLSRQHYLLLAFPSTYRKLIELGISDEYTMGYAQETGFRAGMATPFPWYDLQKEASTSLQIHPFMVMDVTLRSYLKLSPEAALERIQLLVENTREVNGHFISLWHNNSLGEYEEWVGWRKVHDGLLELAR